MAASHVHGVSQLDATAVTLPDWFMRHVSPEPNSGCWIWTLNADRYGYGWMKPPWGASRGAYRLAWELANGREMRNGKVACHTCDQKWCVNPAHIVEGTYTWNRLDAARKGKARNGGIESPARSASMKAIWADPVYGALLRKWRKERDAA